MALLVAGFLGYKPPAEKEKQKSEGISSLLQMFPDGNIKG